MRNKLTFFLKCFLAMMAVRIASAFLYVIGVSLEILDKEIFRTEISLSSKYGLTTALILMIVIIPIVEEFTFRGWLTKEKKIILLSVPFIIFTISQLLFNLIFPQLGSLRYIITSTLVVGLGLFCLNKINHVESLIHKYFNLLTKISIALFTLIHVFNYQVGEITSTGILTLFLILIPYPFSGYILTNLRLRNGLLWSILLHMFTNSLILIQISTSDYSP